MRSILRPPAGCPITNTTNVVGLKLLQNASLLSFFLQDEKETQLLALHINWSYLPSYCPIPFRLKFLSRPHSSISMFLFPQGVCMHALVVKKRIFVQTPHCTIWQCCISLFTLFTIFFHCSFYTLKLYCFYSFIVNFLSILVIHVNTV